MHCEKSIEGMCKGHMNQQVNIVQRRIGARASFVQNLFDEDVDEFEVLMIFDGGSEGGAGCGEGRG